MVTIEGNKLIAEFMDCKINNEVCFESIEIPLVPFSGIRTKIGRKDYGLYEINGLRYNPFELKYHTSWDWLMPVVEKIETEGYRFTISSTFIRVHTCKKSWDDVDEYSVGAFEGKLKATWFAVIEFIKWYNTQAK